MSSFEGGRRWVNRSHRAPMLLLCSLGKAVQRVALHSPSLPPATPTGGAGAGRCKDEAGGAARAAGRAAGAAPRDVRLRRWIREAGPQSAQPQPQPLVCNLQAIYTGSRACQGGGRRASGSTLTPQRDGTARTRCAARRGANWAQPPPTRPLARRRVGSRGVAAWVKGWESLLPPAAPPPPPRAAPPWLISRAAAPHGSTAPQTE